MIRLAAAIVRLRLRLLHRDRSAAMAPLYGFVLLFFAWGAMTILNTGEVVYDRMKAQNAADAIVLAHAEETARTLNVMAMNNMALTQMMVVGAVSTTLAATLVDIERRGVVAHIEIDRSMRRLCRGHWIWVAACIALHMAIHAQVAVAEARAIGIFAKYRPLEGVATAGRLITALNAMNDNLVEEHARRAGKVVKALADANGIDGVFLYPPCTRGRGSCSGNGEEGGDLPVHRDGAAPFVAFREVCDGAERGSNGTYRTDYLNHGYPRGKGPYTAGGSRANPHLRDHVNVVTGFSSLLPYFGEATLDRWDPLIRFSYRSQYRDHQGSRTNDFTRRMDRYWNALCGAGGTIASALSVAGFPLPRPYWLKGRSAVLSAISPVAATGFDRPEELALLALIARDRGKRVNDEDFKEREDPYHAYAQALVYNPQSFDLFTAEWTAALTPATLMDEPHKVVAALRSRRRDTRFDLFTRILEAAPHASDWRLVNTH